MKATGCSSS